MNANSKYLDNAGTIQGNGNCYEEFSYIAGIVAFASSIQLFHNFVNIGIVKGGDYQFVGGIAAYFSGSQIGICSNSGIIEGGQNSCGGLIGYLGNGHIKSCINTNWIETNASNRGSIIGYVNAGSFDSCYYDNQMSLYGAVNNMDYS